MNYFSDRWDASDGIQDLSGDLRKGGHLHGKFAREWLFKSQVRYRWNLEIDAVLP